MATGRPLKFKSPEQLQAKIDAYFASCWKETPIFKDGKQIGVTRHQARPYTITGLALDLDTTRETLIDYERDNPKFTAYSEGPKGTARHF
jgi:hypothetical protein